MFFATSFPPVNQNSLANLALVAKTSSFRRSPEVLEASELLTKFHKVSTIEVVKELQDTFN
jgi:hypothetical protein